MANEKKIVEAKKIVANAATFDVLQRPIISEKAAKLAEANGLAFEVSPSATKKDIANAISAIYNVSPLKINIVNAKGKVKSFRNKSKGTQRTIKKAYITLPKGQTIDILAEAGKK
jgi:large subunit ribosomal protein L23